MLITQLSVCVYYSCTRWSGMLLLRAPHLSAFISVFHNATHFLATREHLFLTAPSWTRVILCIPCTLMPAERCKRTEISALSAAISSAVHDCAATVAASRGHERFEMLPVAAQNDALRTFPCGVMEREICASGNCTKPNKNWGFGEVAPPLQEYRLQIHFFNPKSYSWHLPSTGFNLPKYDSVCRKC